MTDDIRSSSGHPEHGKWRNEYIRKMTPGEVEFFMRDTGIATTRDVESDKALLRRCYNNTPSYFRFAPLTGGTDLSRPLACYLPQLNVPENRHRHAYLALRVRLAALHSLMHVYPRSESSVQDATVHARLASFLQWHIDGYCRHIFPCPRV